MIPLRGFADAHVRLRSVLNEAQRADLAQALAEIVLAAATPHPVVVVTSDLAVAQWASRHGAAVIEDPGSLNAAAAAGQAYWAERGFERAVIAHGDLAAVRSFAAVIDGVDADAVLLVPCQRNDGTTVISVPTHLPFEFAYGSGSLARHRAHGAARIVNDTQLGLDIDVPEDLDALPEPIRTRLGLATPTPTA